MSWKIDWPTIIFHLRTSSAPQGKARHNAHVGRDERCRLAIRLTLEELARSGVRSKGEGSKGAEEVSDEAVGEKRNTTHSMMSCQSGASEHEHVKMARRSAR